MRILFLTEYDEAKAISEWRQDGIDEANKRVATEMLKDNVPLHTIEKYSRLSESAIRAIAKELKIAVVE